MHPSDYVGSNPQSRQRSHLIVPSGALSDNQHIDMRAVGRRSQCFGSDEAKRLVAGYSIIAQKTSTDACIHTRYGISRVGIVSMWVLQPFFQLVDDGGIADNEVR